MTDEFTTKPPLGVLRGRYLTEAGRCHATMLRASAENKPGEQHLEMGKESAYRAAASIIPTVFNERWDHILGEAKMARIDYMRLRTAFDVHEASDTEVDDAWDEYVSRLENVFFFLLGNYGSCDICHQDFTLEDKVADGTVLAHEQCYQGAARE